MNEGRQFQDWILEHMKALGPNGEAPVLTPVPPPPVIPEPQPHVPAADPDSDPAPAPPASPAVRKPASFFPLFPSE